MIYTFDIAFLNNSDVMSDNLDKDELLEMATHGIGLRIALRSSGRLKDSLLNDLLDEQQNLYTKSEEDLKKNIQFHSQAYKNEKISHD